MSTFIKTIISSAACLLCDTVHAQITNAAFGTNVLSNVSSGANNTGGGYEALFNTTTGSNNVALGSQALFSNTSGNQNVAIGYRSLYLSTTGIDLTAVGYNTLPANTTGAGNTAFGYNALSANTTGNQNEANGTGALALNTTGSLNTANGYKSVNKNTTGGDNTGTGYDALNNNTTGSDNTAEGYQALYNATGSSNIAIGSRAGANLTTGNGNIDLFDPGVAGESDTIRIGTQSTQTTTYIAGISGVTVASGVEVFVNASGQLGTVTSSQRFKTGVRDMGRDSEAILALRPVTFRYKHEIDPAGTPQYGLVAEEVVKVAPELVARDASNRIYAVRYAAVNAMLLNEFRKEHELVLKQQDEIAELTSRLRQVEELAARLNALQKDALGK